MGVQMRGRERGLTLIELAIVLVIVGILIGMGASIVGILVKRAKYNESVEVVNSAVQGIIGFATSSRRLPTDSELSSAVRTTRDSYGRDIAYIYDSDLTTSSTYGFCGLTSTDITVRVCADASCSSVVQTINNVAFVVVSGDGNYNNQTAGTQAITSATTINVYLQGIVVNDGYPGDVNVTEAYDDIVRWVSLSELQSEQGCEALTINSPTTLPSATEDSAYTYTLQARGGRPPYTWSGTIGDGLTLNSNGTITGTVNLNTSTTTGEISGCSDNITFTATVTDDAGQSVSQSFTIPVNARPVEIITNSLPNAYEGSAYSADIDAIGGNGSYTFSSSPLPSWLTLNSSTGVLSGTPPADAGCSESLINFTVSVSSCSNTNTKGFSITVNDPDCTASTGGGGGGSGGGTGGGGTGGPPACNPQTCQAIACSQTCAGSCTINVNNQQGQDIEVCTTANCNNCEGVDGNDSEQVSITTGQRIYICDDNGNVLTSINLANVICANTTINFDTTNNATCQCV